MKHKPLLVLSFFLVILTACSASIEEQTPLETPIIKNSPPQSTPANAQKIHTEIGSGEIPMGALSPDALQYLGAFRLPDDSGEMGWDYSGHGMTYYPNGDPGSAQDGFPGSLFVVGHDQQLYVAEISIPQPVNSKGLADLNTAQTLQPFADITGGAISQNLDIPRLGIAYLPGANGDAQGKIHFVLGHHFQEFEPSHGWASLDLSAPDAQGLWVFDDFSNYTTNDYIFPIPEQWIDAYDAPYPLASGRFREGVWGGLGPALFAYDPEGPGNPPGPGSTLTAVQPLLLYGTQVEGAPDILTDDSMRMNGYAESDHWWDGAWLTSTEGDAVIFTGTKALGENWYGFANGVVWAYDCAENPAVNCPEVPDFPFDNRGYWAEDYIPAILFFNPDDLAKVAVGEIAPHDPQPYALLDLSTYWFDPEVNHALYKRDLAGAAAFDRSNGLLYIIERLADEYKSIIHVFKISGN